MLVWDKKIGRLEVVIEKHVTTLGKLIAFERPGLGQIILDFGKFSLMLTDLTSCQGRKRRWRWARRLALAVGFGFVASSTVVASAQVYNAARDYIAGDHHPQ